MLVLALGASFIVVAGILNVYDFLSVTDRVPGKILVVEAWFYQSPSFGEVLSEYERGGYEEVIVVGSSEKAAPDQETGSSSAMLAAKRLERLGLDARSIIPVTSPHADSERTYGLGLALRDYFLHHPDKSGDVNVLTMGVHARKSRMLFQAALGEEYRVGVVSAKVNFCRGNRWFLSCECIGLVARNVAGYLYALALVAKYKF